MFDLITLTSWSKDEKVGSVFSFSILFLRKKIPFFFSPNFLKKFQLKKNFGGKFSTMVL